MTMPRGPKDLNKPPAIWKLSPRWAENESQHRQPVLRKAPSSTWTALGNATEHYSN